MKYGLGDQIIKLEIPYRNHRDHAFIADINIEIDMTTLIYEVIDGKNEVVDFDWDIISDTILVDKYDDAFQFVIHAHNTKDSIHDLYRGKFMAQVGSIVAENHSEILNEIIADLEA